MSSDCEVIGDPAGTNTSEVTKPVRQRRKWTLIKEYALIQVVKELLQQEHKCDNAFRPGVLEKCTRRVSVRVPGSNLTPEHVKYKFQSWKKVYGHVRGMATTSGFGWDDVSKKVVVDDDQVWNEYVRVHPTVSGWRGKAWPLYEYWLIIFGLDRATGATAADPEKSNKSHSMPASLLVLGKRKSISAGPVEYQTEFLEGSCNTQVLTEGTNESTSALPNSTQVLKKIPTAFALTPRNPKNELLTREMFEGIVKLYIEGTNSKTESIGQKIAAVSQIHASVNVQGPKAASEPTLSDKVLEAVTALGVSGSMRVIVTARLLANRAWVDLFLSLDEEEDRKAMLTGLAAGKI